MLCCPGELWCNTLGERGSMAEASLKAWNVSEEEFPARGPMVEQMRSLVQYAILAPSGHNTQPWLFKICGRTIELYADRRRRLPVVDPHDRELTISCGAALYHLRLAAHYFGYAISIHLLPNPATPDLLARMRMVRRYLAAGEERTLFRAIPRRHTNRRPFESLPPPASLLTALNTIVEEEGAWIHAITDRKKRRAIADLVAEGGIAQMRDECFRRELAAWVRPNPRTAHDGIPARALGFPDILAPLGPFVIRAFNLGESQARKDHESVLDAPMLLALGTAGDTPREWLQAGQALAHVLLRACVDGASASFFNQPIEVVSLRPKVSEILGRDGAPQLLLRLGYGPHIHPTPRRVLDDVLLPC